MGISANPALTFSRLRWRARRGILENDLWLNAFLRQREAASLPLSETELRAFYQLLELSEDSLLKLWAGNLPTAQVFPNLTLEEALAINAILHASGASAPSTDRFTF